MDGKEAFALANAILNTISTALLIGGFIAIRRRRVRAHVRCMVAALTTSAAFLASYVASKAIYGEKTSGLEPGLLRSVYFAVLFPHLALAIGMLPMIGVTVWRALRGQYEKHRRIARPTLAIWLYVSVTGVVIYVMLYHVIPGAAGG